MQKQWQLAVTAESLADEQGSETYAPTVLPAVEARLRPEEKNQTFEDNPAKVSR